MNQNTNISFSSELNILKALNVESPDYEIINGISNNMEKYRESLLSIVTEYADVCESQTLDEIEDESYTKLDDLEYPTIHALRILGAHEEVQVLDPVFRIISELGDEWDLIVIDVCHQVLAAVARSELFDIYWEQYLNIVNRQNDKELELTYLDHVASCKNRSQRFRDELVKRFYEEPAQMASSMRLSQDPYYVPFFEKWLFEIAPIVKYLPFDRMKYSEHHEWIEVGGSWLYFKRKAMNNLRDWEKKIDSNKIELSRFYRPIEKHSNSDKKDKTHLREDALKEVAEDRAELAAHFLNQLPDQRESNLLGLKSDIDEILDDYLNEIKISQTAKSKTGRNDSCPCGSGKKFKKCCL